MALLSIFMLQCSFIKFFIHDRPLAQHHIQTAKCLQVHLLAKQISSIQVVEGAGANVPPSRSRPKFDQEVKDSGGERPPAVAGRGRPPRAGGARAPDAA